MNLEQGIYTGVVVSASGGSAVAQGTISYRLAIQLPAGVVNVDGVQSFQRLWPTNQLVDPWPVGTPLTVSVVAGRAFGAFVERPTIGNCA